MKKTARFVAAGITTIALAGGIGAGIAYADPSSPAPTPTASGSPAPKATPTSKPGKAAKKRPLTARALHGEVTLAGKQHRVVDFQRGTVTKVSADSVTVRSADGFTGTYVVTENTKVRLSKEKSEIGAVKTDDRVRVVALKTGSTSTARSIADHGKK